ncbi:MAG: ABC transporter permease [Acidobacteriaceae bacterium]|nr:ABC transporter permease [Acidobacteriaceae bacterium]
MPDWKKEIRDAMAQAGLEPGREESIVEELSQHLSEQYSEMLRNGMSEDEAYRKVLHDLNAQKLSAELRPIFTPEQASIAPGSDEHGRFFTGLGKDLVWAMRSLRLNAGFAMVAVLSLALGVGANTAIFQLIDAVVLRTLPVPAPETLAGVREIHSGRVGSSVTRQQEMSSAIWEQLRQRQQAFSSIAAWATEAFNLGHGGEARYADGLWVSGDFFKTLQVKPIMGRLFSPIDDRKGCGAEGAVISYSFWRGKLGGREDVAGSLLSLNGQSFPIIGVTPSTFSGLEVGRKFDVALPLCSEPLLHAEGNWTDSQTTWWLAAIGRLKPGWTLDRATAQLVSIAPPIFAATLPPGYDETERQRYLHFSFRALPAATGVSLLRNDYEQPLWLLLGISGAVLLIACANIANLMLARATARQQEMGVRLALGASRLRLFRQLLVESLLLAAAGAAVGGALAMFLSRALIAGLGSEQDSVFLTLPTDWRVLAFTAGLAVFTCVIFGLAPALHAAKTEPGIVVKTGGRAMTAGRQRLLVRRGFIIAQVALSLVLVVTAMLFVRTFQNLVRLNLGFNQNHILVADFDLSPLKLPPPTRLAYKRELLEQVRTIPGVVSAATTGIVPLSGNGWNEFIDFPGTNLRRKLVYFSDVSSGYFRTLDVPLLIGRDFNDSDTANSPPAAIVNQSFAKKFLGGTDCIGKVFGQRQDGGKPEKVYRIVGLVGDTRYRNLREPYVPIVFVAQNQSATPDLDFTVLIHSNEDITSLISSLKTVAQKRNPEIVLNFSVLHKSIREGLGRERLMAALSGFYGALAAILSLVGLYGIMSYTTLRRTSEMGIRMALGASRGRILGMIVGDAMRMLAVGIVIGIILVAASGQAVQRMLFGLKPTDSLSLGLAIAAMTLIALGASALPARRAANLQPMQTLREE